MDRESIRQYQAEISHEINLVMEDSIQNARTKAVRTEYLGIEQDTRIIKEHRTHGKKRNIWRSYEAEHMLHLQKT